MNFMDIIKLIKATSDNREDIKSTCAGIVELIGDGTEFIFPTKAKAIRQEIAEENRKIKDRNIYLLREICRLYKTKYGESWRLKLYDDFKNTDTFSDDEYMSVIEGA